MPTKKSVAALSLLALVAGVALVVIIRSATGNRADTIQGVVMSQSGPVAGAVVRFQTDAYYTVSDAKGRFEIPLRESDAEPVLTAWSPGYYVGKAETIPTDEAVYITLAPYYTTDNPGYNWFSHEGADGSLSCSHCMPCYDEWSADAHSQSAVNPRFLSLYNGTSLSGETSPPTAYRFDPSLGISVPVAPSLGQDAAGPGFRLDYPNLGGNCATCHAPAAAALPGSAYNVNINTLVGVQREGVFCEFCHKVGEVKLNPATGMPDPSLPGVLSMRLYRPEGDQQLFFGNFDDVTRRVSYLPLIQESAFCAACHSGSFWGTVAYNSFGEWLESPYSDPKTGQTCQNCHMPVVDYDYFVLPEMGGLTRDHNRIFSHRMPGAMDTALLEKTATLAVEASRESDRLQVSVSVTNSGAGHDIPTDNPLRNMILLVSATSNDGQSLPLMDGPTIPAWGGVGDPQNGYYAGLPGVLYAKILADFYTGETPTYAYWRQTRLISDNRIPALATDESAYYFALPDAAGPAMVEARLFLRRAFIDLMALKGWDTPDILMAQAMMTVEP